MSKLPPDYDPRRLPPSPIDRHPSVFAAIVIVTLSAIFVAFFLWVLFAR
jgi:hypothetical protein